MFNAITENYKEPIFSSFSNVDPNFTDNMDEYVPEPNQYKKEQYEKVKNNLNETKNINADALNNVPNVAPDIAEQLAELEKLPSKFDELNIYTAKDIEAWKKKGTMGIAEMWQKNHRWATFLPYVNSTKDTANAINTAVIANKFRKGEELTNKQQEILVDYLRNAKEAEVRGMTFGAGAIDIALQSIPFMEEFAIGLATTAGGVGFASLAKTLSNIAAKKNARTAVKKALEEAAIESTMTGVKKTLSLSAKKNIYKQAQKETLKHSAKSIATGMNELGTKGTAKLIAKATPQAIKSSAYVATVKMPQRFIGNIADRQIATGVYVTDEGQAVFSNPENLALSCMKALADSTFDILTESMGFLLSPIAGYFAKPVRGILPKAFYKGFEKLVSSRYGMEASEALKKFGFNGILEEMGEEQLNRFLCQAFGLNTNKLSDYFNLDTFLQNVFYFDREGKHEVEGLKTGLKNAAIGYGQEGTSFALVGGGGHLVAGGLSKGLEKGEEFKNKSEIKKLTDKANKYIKSPEEFYLDQGLIKINGSQSLAEQKLRNYWNLQGVDGALQNDVISASSQAEIREMLKTTIEDLRANGISTKTGDERLKEKYENDFYEKATKAGVDKSQAFSLAKMVSTFGMKYVPEAKRDEWFERMKIRYNVPASATQDEADRIDTIEKQLKAIEIEIAELDELSEPEAFSDEQMQRYSELEEQYNKLYAQKNNGYAPVEDSTNNENSMCFQSVETAGADVSVRKAIIEWKEKGTESKYFKKWFGDSKVVDENGKPLVVYHGTKSKFEIFDINKLKSNSGESALGEGFYFTDNVNRAERYAYGITGRMRGQGERNVMQVYLSIKNPARTMREFDPEIHDGIIYKNGSDTTYVFLKPEQIKSLDNQGTFDSNNPNIYYQGLKAPIDNVVDLTNEFDKVPTFEEVRKYLYNILDNEISFNTKTKGFKIDIKQTTQKRGNSKPTQIVNKLTKQGAKVGQSTKKRNNKYLLALEKIINNATKVGEPKENTKANLKPHVLNYYNFDVPVKIGEFIYTVRLQTEEWKGEKPNNGIKTVHLYNIYEKQKTPWLDPKDNMSSKNSHEVTNSIIDNANNFNPYYTQETENSEQIKSVNNQGTFDSKNPNIYFQIDEDVINNQKTDKPVKIEVNKNIKVDNIKPIEISSKLPFELSKKAGENKKAIYEVLGLNEKHLIIINSDNKVNVKKNTISETLSKVNTNSEEYPIICNALCNIENLFESAQKILSHGDFKKDTNNRYDRYANIVKINNKDCRLMRGVGKLSRGTKSSSRSEA